MESGLEYEGLKKGDGWVEEVPPKVRGHGHSIRLM